MKKAKAALHKIFIASDHAGLELKQALQLKLGDLPWEDLGPYTDDRVDYPDYAAALSKKVLSGSKRGRAMGVLICGSGIGMSISANKVRGIRAALVENPVAARLSREHNDANVLCLGARFLAHDYAAEIVDSWVSSLFTEDARHRSRIQKIHLIEKNPTKKR